MQLGGSPRESSSLSLNQGYLVLTCTSDLFVAGGVLSTLSRREEDMSKSRQESGGPGLSNYDGEGENYLEKKNTLPLATD